MKRTLFVLLFAAVACSRETAPPPTETIDARTPIAVLHVAGMELQVREQPNDTAPVIATYQNGEAVSVLAKQGEWSEVRTGTRTGWAKNSELGTAEAKAQAEENPTPKFRRMPLPVSAPSIRGNIYLEADVNTDGDVLSVRIINNTTGSETLARQNMESLKSAKFEPIVVKGERKAFKYYHNVDY